MGRLSNEGDGRREWEGCPMKKTEGERGEAVHEGDGKRGWEGCT